MFDDNFAFANRVSKLIILLQVKFMVSLGSLSTCSFDTDAKKTEFLFYLVPILQYSKAI